MKINLRIIEFYHYISIFVENIKILAIESYGTILNKKVDVISNYKAYKPHCSPDEC